MKRAAVIRHLCFENLGNLAKALEDQSYIVEYWEAGSDNLTHISTDTDLLVILGGPISACDEKDYPFLIDELRLLEHRLENNLPTLGICLGAQLMARTLGSKVYPGAQKEIGWAPLTLSLSGQQTPIVHLAGYETQVLHWHGDTFDLPVGAIHLASSALYDNQAFSWGRKGLALQFHPEVIPQNIERWLIGHAFEISKAPDVTVSKIREDTSNYAKQLSLHAAKY